jgi:hypothetical protein
MRHLGGLLFVLSGVAIVRADVSTIQTPAPPSYSCDGYYVGPAQRTDNGQGPIDRWRGNFANETNVPRAYYANVSTVSSPTGARFTIDSDFATDDQTTAWLMSQHDTAATKTNQSVGGPQFAIWVICHPVATALPGNQEFMSGVPATPDAPSMAPGASSALLALFFLPRRKRICACPDRT